MDITGQARTGQRGVPMPTGESLAQALELQARQDLQFVENNIALSLTKGAKGE